MTENAFDRLAAWQQNLIRRLELALSRPMTDADLTCVAWNAHGRTLTVQSLPLLTELRSRNLVSNTFRTYSAR